MNALIGNMFLAAGICVGSVPAFAAPCPGPGCPDTYERVAADCPGRDCPPKNADVKRAEVKPAQAVKRGEMPKKSKKAPKKSDAVK